MKFNTRAIHKGQEPEKTTGAVVPPIYQTSTYAQEYPAQLKGYDYTRAGNPNYQNLEETLASLESGEFATVFSSGCGAATTILSLLKSGDQIISSSDVYGGTYRLFEEWGGNFGLETHFVNTTIVSEVEKAITSKTKLIWIESPTNPLLAISDIQEIAKLAHSKNIWVLVDNTFLSAYFQNPLLLGADFVLHSTTKYLGGHSDIVGGCIVTNDKKLHEKIQFYRKTIGTNPSPFDCWLLQRSLKTLGIRMERHQENAIAIAEFLETHPKVKKVFYPGLEKHPQHEIAKKQQSGFGGIISVEFNLSVEETKKLISSFQFFTLAESLGGVESLVNHPATMTHASIPAKKRYKNGLSDSLVRFSVGIEDSADLIRDLQTTLANIT